MFKLNGTLELIIIQDLSVVIGQAIFLLIPRCIILLFTGCLLAVLPKTTTSSGPYARTIIEAVGTHWAGPSMFTTYGDVSSPSYRVRAVVSLPTSCTFGKQIGDESNPITINW